MLRILDDVKTADLYSINWSGGDKRFELRYQPTLLFALLNCDRLVDSEMQPVTVSHEQAEIVLCMELVKKDDLKKFTDELKKHGYLL